MSSDSSDLDEEVEEYIERQREQGNEIITPENREKDDEGLIPLSIDEALEEHRAIQESNNRSINTIESHRSRLKKFCAWLLINDVEETTDIEGHHFRAYRKQRSKNVKKVTVKTHMDTIRKFIRHLEGNYVEENLSQLVKSPGLNGEEGQRNDHLPVDRGDTILKNVRKYMWGSMKHVLFELWWAGAIRLGGVHSLDADDFDPDEGAVELRHRPETGTTLKNGDEGERDVSLASITVDAIQDYLDNPERPDTMDEYGREPLLASPDGGRFSKAHLRNVTYHLTLPCLTEDGCPHDRDPQECQYRRNKNDAHKCKSSKAPHALRSGALTRQLKRGIDPRKVSDRANVGLQTLEDHYNQMTEREKMRVRRNAFDEEYRLSHETEELDDRLFDN